MFLIYYCACERWVSVLQLEVKRNDKAEVNIFLISQWFWDLSGAQDVSGGAAWPMQPLSAPARAHGVNTLLSLLVAVHSQISTNFEVWQCYSRGFCLLCRILCHASPAAPSSQKQSVSQSAPGIAEGEERLQSSHHRSLSSALPAHGQGSSPKTERTEWWFAQHIICPKYCFINLHSCKIQYSSFDSEYFFLNLIFTTVIVLISLFTVKSLFIRTSAFVYFFAKHPLLRMAAYCRGFF